MLFAFSLALAIESAALSSPGGLTDLEVFRFDFKEERPGVNDLIEFPARGFKVQGKRIGDFNSEE